MTRINQKYTRIYSDGYDLSSYASDVGTLSWLFPSTLGRALSDEVLNGLSGHMTVGAGPINGMLDGDAAGLRNLASSGEGTRTIMIGFGTTAAPIAGNPMFAWQFEQAEYKVGQGEGFVPVTVNIENASALGVLTQTSPWGFIVHPKGAETAVNTAVGLDDNGAATAKGGVFCYQLFSSNGTCTLSLDDAATNTNPSFAALSGATSGSINASVTPKSGMVALGTTDTVRRYIRWQIAFGTATTATFAVGFIRSYF